MITLCKDVYVDFEPRPGVLDLEHVADTCARDRGLHIDVVTNIDKVLDTSQTATSAREVARLGRTRGLAQDMTTEHTESLRWRLRARIGKRLRWYNEIEAQFEGRSTADGSGSRGRAGGAGEAG